MMLVFQKTQIFSISFLPIPLQYLQLGAIRMEVVSILTRAVALKDNIQKIKSAGIKRINVSLDTINPEKFAKITGMDLFDQVWQGIETALEMGFDPIKINVVALNGVNDDELIDIK